MRKLKSADVLIGYLFVFKGFQVVFAGNTPADGTRTDVMPQNELQRKAAELNPAKATDVMIGTLPLISQRMLAAASGVGFFGMSGNILTESHGAAVSLGAVITTADLVVMNARRFGPRAIGLPVGHAWLPMPRSPPCLAQISTCNGRSGRMPARAALR